MSPPEGLQALRPAPDPAEASLWAALIDAKSPERYAQAWLSLQSRGLGGVQLGAVLMGPSAGGRYRPLAFWPDRRLEVKSLERAAQRAALERRPVILPAEPLPGRSSVAPLVQQIAHPILIDERVHGVVVLAVEPRDPHELAVAMRQLQWGMAWLELLLCREHAERDARVIERQRTALDLVASLLDQEHSAAGLSAFAGELATRLECERASVGLLVHGQLRVSVLSRGVDSGRRGKLIRALEAAMEEALDHPEPVVFPAAAGSAAGTVRAHVELARISGSGSIASLPLARGGRAIGVLTVERSAERPIDAAALALCAAVAALAGPVIEIGRRDERSLAVWIADRVRARLRSWRCSLPRWLS